MSTMSKNIPVTKNQQLEVKIESITNEAQGVARVDGYTLFVPDALPGETVRVQIIKVTARYAIAKLLSVITTNPDRVMPLCPVYSRCGGCGLQHLSYPAQLMLKKQTVYDALTRLGGQVSPAVADTRGMDMPWNYRNKGSFPFGMDGNQVINGFFSQRSHRIVAVSGCPIHDEKINRAVNLVTHWANDNHISVYDETSGKGLLRHVMVRTSTSGETMVVLVVSKEKVPAMDGLLRRLSDYDSVYLNVNPKNTNVIFDYAPGAFRLLQGKEALRETILGLDFSISPMSFLQVNPVQTSVLYGEALRLLNPTEKEVIIDGYCGVGTISLSIAKHAGKVIGIEQVPQAIENAKENAKRNSISNAEFLCGNVEDVLPTLDGNVDAVVIDPPRKGCEEIVLHAIAASKANRIVYVSCNPATLARDVKILTGLGFALQQAVPVDMFPHTPHVETVCLLSRKEI